MSSSCSGRSPRLIDEDDSALPSRAWNALRIQSRPRHIWSNHSSITMNALELKIPPPILALCLALLMWFTSLLGQPFVVSFGLRVGVAFALAAIGQSISIAAMVAFRRARTTVNPIKPSAASSLVSGGVYRFTRNPMYLGLLLTLLAWAAFLSNLLALLVVPVFVLYIDRFQVKPEERALMSLFGAEYAAYKNRVRK
jgi:protein-S-isoprenylcysteine O-methyltransferase Ste14